MARILKPLVRGGGWYPSKKWIPLVRNGGYTTQNGGETEPVWATASGAIASFTTPFAYPLKSLVAQINHVQDLHGQSSPWPAGGGKNKLNITGTSTVISGVTVTVNDDGSIKLVGTVTGSSGLTFVLNPGLALESGSWIYSGEGFGTLTGGNGGVFASSGTGQIADAISNKRDGDFSFTSAVNRIWLYFNADTVLNNTVKLMIRPSTVSDSSWQPYSNICPISGWTGCEVTRTGKNLNPHTGVNYTADTYPNGIFLKAGTYIFSLDTGVAFGYNHAMYIKLKDENGNVITKGNISGDGWQLNGSETYYYGGGNSNISKPFNLLKDCYVCFGFNNQYPTDGNNVQLELGSTVSTYEAFSGTTTTVSWQDEAGTVYGGNVDVVTGVLTVDRRFTTIGDESVSVVSGSAYSNFQIVPTEGALRDNSDIVCISSAYLGKSFNGASASDDNIVFASGGNIRIKDTSQASKTASQYKTDNATVQIVYKLATPQTYQLTPQQISTLLGNNTVFVDTGDVEVTYRES